MSNKRNSYLISKAMKHFLFASVLTMAVQQLNLTADGIIVSNYVGPDALSAVNLFMPLSLAITSFGTLFGIGATILAARYIGELQLEKTNKTLSTAVTSVFVAGMILAAGSLLAKNGIVSLICQEERLVGYISTYMTIMMSCSFIVMFSALTNQMTSVDGHPEKVTKAMIIVAVSNIVMDFVFVAVAEWGIAGSAWATVIATSIGVVYLWSYLLSSHCTYSIHPVRLFSMSCLKNNMLQGTPMIISNIVLMLMFATMNNIIQDKQGADGMFVFSICMNLLSIGMMLSGGIGSAVMSIGGFLNGQQDYTGLRMLVNRGIKILEVLLICLVFIIQICPNIVTGLFGANSEELMNYSNGCLRIFSWLLPFVLLALLLANVYQLLGKLIMPPLVVLAFPLVLIPSMIICPNIAGDDSVWYAFPLTGVLVMLLTILISEIFRRREQGLSFLTLVPQTVISNKLELSVRSDRKSMEASLEDVVKYLKSLEMDRELCNNVNLCVEEVLLNIVEHSGNTSDSHYFDVIISKSENTVIASVKDDGAPFDPVKCSEKAKGMGLKILHALCCELDYKYMYGQNMTFMKWNINK